MNLHPQLTVGPNRRRERLSGPRGIKSKNALAAFYFFSTRLFYDRS